MFESELKRIREAVNARSYLMTVHADEEMDEDGLTIFDVENVLLTGDIIERQKDRVTGESKFLVRGIALQPMLATVVVKFGFTGMLIIITVYVDE